MLILPPGHADAIATRRRLSSREKWMVGGVLGVVVVLAVVLVVSLSSGGPSSTNGCIYATIPGDVGAQQIHQCGTQARDTCSLAEVRGAYTEQAAATIAAECRKAGLPVGPQQ